MLKKGGGGAAGAACTYCAAGALFTLRKFFSSKDNTLNRLRRGVIDMLNKRALDAGLRCYLDTDSRSPPELRVFLSLLSSISPSIRLRQVKCFGEIPPVSACLAVLKVFFSGTWLLNQSCSPQFTLNLRLILN